jgi:pantoate--beta-alanine ligase
MYPVGEQTRVRVGQVATALCGAYRPGHFEGVATIVTKLLALVGPCLAVFGRKDYQQVCVIERLVTDLLLPVTVAAVPIVREPDGLALSSRNRYLSVDERGRALALARGLSAAAEAFAAGERSVAALRRHAERPIAASFDRIDYVTLADAVSVVPLADDDRCPERALLAVAAHLGGTRLIDNVLLGDDPAPLAAGKAGSLAAAKADS